VLGLLHDGYHFGQLLDLAKSIHGDNTVGKNACVSIAKIKQPFSGIAHGFGFLSAVLLKFNFGKLLMRQKRAASVSEGRLRCFNSSTVKRLAGGQVEFAADAGVGGHGVGPFGVGGKLDGEPPVGDG